MSKEKAFNRGLAIAMAKLAAEGFEPVKPDDAYDKDQLTKGMNVELEHSEDLEMAKTIAKHHIDEIPDYYDRLDDMEEEAKEELNITEPGEKPEPKTNPVDKGIAKGMIKAFLDKNPNPEDDQMHELAESIGYEPDKFEELVYEMLSETMGK